MTALAAEIVSSGLSVEPADVGTVDASEPVIPGLDPVGGGEVSDPVGGGAVSDPVGGGAVSDPVGGGAVSDPVGGGEVSDPEGGGAVSDPVGGGEVSDPVGGGAVSDPVGAGLSDPVAGGTLIGLVSPEVPVIGGVEPVGASHSSLILAAPLVTNLKQYSSSGRPSLV